MLKKLTCRSCGHFSLGGGGRNLSNRSTPAAGTSLEPSALTASDSLVESFISPGCDGSRCSDDCGVARTLGDRIWAVAGEDFSWIAHVTWIFNH